MIFHPKIVQGPVFEEKIFQPEAFQGKVIFRKCFSNQTFNEAMIINHICQESLKMFANCVNCHLCELDYQFTSLS